MDSSTNGATPWPVSVRPVQGGPMQTHPTAKKKNGDPQRCAVVKPNNPRGLDDLLRLLDAMAGTNLIVKPMQFAHGLDHDDDACAFAPLAFLDLDTEPKQPCPPDAWQTLLDLCGDGKLPGVVFAYETAHGARLVVQLDEAPADLSQRADVVSELHARMQPVLDDAAPVFKLDAVMRGTQGVWAPGGVKADGTVHPVNVRRFNADPISTEALAEAFAKRIADADTGGRVNDAAPKRPRMTIGGRGGGGEHTGGDDLRDARTRWNDAHPLDEGAKQECPLCGSDDGFHAGGDHGPARWFCYSTNHAERAPSGVGQHDDDGRGFGDALDLEAHRRGFEHADDLLRADGYLPEREAETDRTPFDEPDEGEPDPWKGVPLSWFDDVPPAREYLLRHPTRDGKPCPPRHGDGFLPRGKAGTLTSAGGVGKTNSMVQLAVAVATGAPWLGHFHTSAGGGRVLLLLGEEDAAEARRRLFYVCKALDLDAADRQAVASSVVVLPLAGVACPLLRLDKADAVTPTKALEALHARLDTHAGDGWALIVMDPQARFAGVDAESSNALATRFVQECERLTQAPGNPTLLVVAHSSKLARRMDSADSRGVTALTDGFRWHATMVAKNGGVELDVQKNNYARPSDPLHLERADGGLLFAETDADRERREREEEERKREAETKREKRQRLDDAERVLRVLRWLDGREPTPNREAIGLAAGIGSKKNAAAAVALAVALGYVTEGEARTANNRRVAAFSISEAGRDHLRAQGESGSNPGE